MKPSSITLIFGTRPEVIKLAPVVSALRQSSFQVTLVHTGQHETLTNDLLRYFTMEPDIRLPKTPGASNDFDQLLGLMGSVSGYMDQHQTNLVMVQGDTASALAGAMAAHYSKTPVAHVEAGLRSFDRSQPFPEETNRILISSLADLHFAPTQAAADQLIREQVKPESVFFTGNTIVDALQSVLQTIETPESVIRERYELENRRLILLTTHRRENLGDPQRRILKAVNALALEVPEALILWPVHPNPVIRQVLDEMEFPSNVRIIQPLSYVDFVPLLSLADLVLTDSGGIQEEAPALGVPVVVLREKTERPEVMEAGMGILAGSDPESILSASRRFLSATRPATPVQLYGDGTASHQIAALLSEWLVGRMR